MKHLMLILFLASPFLHGQNRDLGPGSSIFANNLGDFALQKVDRVYSGEYSNTLSGKLYLFDDWEKCTIKTNLKEEGLNFVVPCNYNLYNDQFEMMVDEEIYFLQHDVITEIQQGSRIFIPNEDLSENQKSYFEIIGEGEKFYLAKVYELKIKDVQSKKSLGLYEKKINTKDKKYFVDKTNNILLEVPRSKQKVFALLNLNREDQKKIKGKLRRTEALIQAVQLAD